MATLIATDALLQVLDKVREPVEIRDSHGRTVGFFAPVSVNEAAAVARALARIDWAEMDRRSQSAEIGYTTREVFQHLQTLTQDEETRAYLQAKIEALAASGE